MRVLFMPFRSPWPPTNGPDNRAWQHLTWLAEGHDVTLVTFGSDRAGTVPSELHSVCRAVHSVPLSRVGATLRTAAGVFSADPLQVSYYRSRRFARLLEGLSRESRFDLAYLGPARMAPYGFQLRGVPRLFDYCDALSLQFERRAEIARGPERWLDRSEARRMRSYEKRLSTLFEKTIIASALDAEVIGGPRPPAVIPVAVGFDPEVPAESPTGLPEGEENVAFFGDMRTSYSESAVLGFLDEVWPLVKRERSGAIFWIVGREPSSLVRIRVRDDVRVTGTVPGFRTFFDRVQVMVAPLLFGSGVKTKVLQAMAAGVPVVGTRYANEGTGAAVGQEILIADDPGRFAQAIVSLLADPGLRQSVGEAGRRFALGSFGTASVRRRFELAVEEALEAGRRSAEA